MKKFVTFLGLLFGSMVLGQNPPAPGTIPSASVPPPPLAPGAQPVDAAPVEPLHGTGYIPPTDARVASVNRREGVARHRAMIRSTVPLPAQFNAAIMSPTTNQGPVGTCAFFSSVRVAQSLLLKNGKAVDLSQQYVIDNIGNGNSCNGANPGDVLDFLVTHGTTTLDQNPYVGCAKRSSGTPSEFLLSWAYVSNTAAPPPDAVLKEAIRTHNMVVVGVAADNSWQTYRGDQGGKPNVLARAGGDVNHAIIVRGWDDNIGAWHIANSWGEGWGNRGDAWVKYGSYRIGTGAAFAIAPGAPDPTPSPEPNPDPVPNPPVPPGPDPDPNPAPSSIVFVTPIYVSGTGYFEVSPSKSAKTYVLPANQPVVLEPSFPVTPVYGGGHAFVQVQPQTQKILVKIPANQPEGAPMAAGADATTIGGAPLPVQAQAPTRPVGTPLVAIIVTSKAKPGPNDAAILGSLDAIKAALANLNCRVESIDYADPKLDERGTKTVVDKGGGTPMLVIQVDAADIVYPLSWDKLPDTPAALIEAVRKARGL